MILPSRVCVNLGKCSSPPGNMEMPFQPLGIRNPNPSPCGGLLHPLSAILVRMKVARETQSTRVCPRLLAPQNPCPLPRETVGHSPPQGSSNLSFTAFSSPLASQPLSFWIPGSESQTSLWCYPNRQRCTLCFWVGSLHLLSVELR